jgi:hypothetical protein
MTALRGFESFDVVSLLAPTEILGPRLAEALAGCADDPCRARQLASLGAGTLVLGSLDELAGVLRLDVRRVETTTTAARMQARVTIEVARGAPGVLETRLYSVAADLFPEEAKRAFATLGLEVEPEGSQIFLDGLEVGRSPIAPLKLRAGPHQLRFSSQGHTSEQREVTLLVGQTKVETVELHRVRGILPWVLGGTAAGAAALGLVLGLSASGTASAWTDACGATGPCEAGFTRARFADDDSAVDTQRTFANVLFGSAVALSIGAVLGYVFDPGEEE